VNTRPRNSTLLLTTLARFDFPRFRFFTLAPWCGRSRNSTAPSPLA
jgi:hypothetical protein